MTADEEQLIAGLGQLFTELRPTYLDRKRSKLVPGPEGPVITLLPALQPEPGIEIAVCGDEVVVSYGEEHVHLTNDDESGELVGPFAVPGLVPKVMAVLRALLTGRIELHVSQRLLLVATRSYWINDHGERRAVSFRSHAAALFAMVAISRNQELRHGWPPFVKGGGGARQTDTVLFPPPTSHPSRLPKSFARLVWYDEPSSPRVIILLPRVTVSTCSQPH